MLYIVPELIAIATITYFLNLEYRTIHEKQKFIGYLIFGIFLIACIITYELVFEFLSFR